MDATNFADAYQDSFKRTVRFLQSRGFAPDLAAELAQGAWTKAWERLPQLREDDRLLNWVNTIALNLGRRAMREQNAFSRWTAECEPITTLNTAEIDVKDILNRCPPGDRGLLWKQLQGSSPRELAEQAGVSEAAMRLRTFRARKAARKLCDPSLN